MGIKHNYLNAADTKPTAAEIDIGELVPNFVDNTLWTKNVAGSVIKVGELSGGNTDQSVDGGTASSNYTSTMTLDGGGA